MKAMILFALGVLFATSVAARLPHAPTQAEQTMLPPFCPIKLKDDNRAPQAQPYIRQFGWDNWLHLHHYCYGLNFVHRARIASNPRDRSYYYQLAVGEYRYVMNATARNFWMRPQLYVELGNLFVETGRAQEAVPHFNDAIRVNPRYAPAYLALVGHHVRSGNRAAALEVATEGLRHLPTVEALRSAYLENGGREPFPEPIAPPERQRSTGQRATADERPVVRDTASPSRAEVTMTPESSYGAGQEEASNIGPQRERSCRFCPPDEIEQRWRETFE